MIIERQCLDFAPWALLFLLLSWLPCSMSNPLVSYNMLSAYQHLSPKWSRARGQQLSKEKGLTPALQNLLFCFPEFRSGSTCSTERLTGLFRKFKEEFELIMMTMQQNPGMSG